MTAPDLDPSPAHAHDRGRDDDERTMREALASIAMGECWSQDVSDESDCTCPVCQARAALKHVGDWRFRGALAHRQDDGLHPAETRMVKAWRAYFDHPVTSADQRFQQILHDPELSTRRDWYVATSVVQWLATNVGSSVLSAAGYRYTLYAEDRKQRDELLPPTLLPKETETP